MWRKQLGGRTGRTPYYASDLLIVISGVTFLSVGSKDDREAVSKKVTPDTMIRLHNPILLGGHDLADRRIILRSSTARRALSRGSCGAFLGACPTGGQEGAPNPENRNSLHCEVSDILIPTTYVKKKSARRCGKSVPRQNAPAPQLTD